MRPEIQDVLVNLHLILAAWIIAQKLPRRKPFLLRSALSLAVMSILRYIYFYKIAFSYLLMDHWNLRSILGYTVLLFLTVGSVVFCFECDFWAALFCGGTSYCAQHICQRIYGCCRTLWLQDLPAYLHILIYLAIIALGLIVMYFLVKPLRADRLVVDNKSQLLALIAVIASTMVLDLTMFRAMGEGGELLLICFTIYSSMISALIFLLQLGLISHKKKELELDTVKSVLKSRQEQYFFEKSLIDTINIKSHDLKHQIALLDGSAQKELSEELKAVVNAYDSTFHTGNEALDVVLTRGSFNCRGKNIHLTCLADGKCLEFMPEVDIYSLFGNILDNAIEATDKIEDEEKRVISLSISQEGYFVNIRAENFFSDKLTFSNGLPESTKGDPLYHGFGMKSIRMIVHSYGGSLKVYTKEDRFVLDIMFSV